ncbi:succinyldiaminopimelate transaminase [Catenulispora sp. NF23]|uniref:Aminotransferase n=1 Tax=Catenulispora pinistramenti TaxID=2705254 RepID=A0ABS5KHI2_9ACTN|nr:succinyldiaminopimelate transaminase [Catenulispora pinistramenti]MBS2536706.1 succinyldiaminopimelate transaminase [Catenulispora pinistramenti]MBS2545769.1 succinyldiaminopimelate transaminase [Catenulispora pinistramenti]
MRKLPDFPWDRLAPAKARAGQHPGGIVDLSVGTPVDPVPAVIQDALRAGSNAPGYPLTHGTPALREAAVGWMTRRLGVTGVTPTAVLPVIGTKELVAWLPTLLGLGPGDHVAIPSVAYPTYDVGARIAGADTLVAAPEAAADLIRARRPKLIWLNSPANPNGRVASAAELRAVVTAARESGTIVVSDECYIELAWDAEPVSLLHPDVSGVSHEGLLAVHSLSKRSNLAGYRAGFITGDPAVVADLLEVRKHAGLIMPQPVQDAMTVALSDDTHAAEQKERYRRRREVLRDALGRAGFRIDHSEAGLYLWSSRDEDCWTTVEWLSERGILVAPGDFYGEAGARHVRVALTASDERVAAAAARLAAF